ncbi:hypothetical protein KTR9_2526 [Gordonia sp. KTR9]|nr:hypothetical protein KTR9_2526 [Gordonia sp. KTR9]
MTDRDGVGIHRCRSAEQVAELRWEWARETDATVGPWQGDVDFVAAVATWLGDDRRTVWTAGTHELAIGMVCLTEHIRMPSPRRAAGGRWGYLGHLYVRPTFRGSGIGEELVRRVTETADDRGYAKTVLSPTEPSIALYERCGFTRDNLHMARRR